MHFIQLLCSIGLFHVYLISRPFGKSVIVLSNHSDTFIWAVLEVLEEHKLVCSVYNSLYMHVVAAKEGLLLWMV